MLFQPRAADLDPAHLENALVRGAVGDCADEASMLLLINFGHWLPQLQCVDLITLAPDVDDRPWAQVTWAELDRALGRAHLRGVASQTSCSAA